MSHLQESYTKNIKCIVRPLDVNILGVKLKEAGIDRERLRTGGTREYYYTGIKLRSELRGQNQPLL
jgi:hypothetical protein